MHRALNIATEIMNTFKTGDQDSVIACRKIAQKFMGDKVDSAAVYKSDLKPIVFATGHCHIGSCFPGILQLMKYILMVLDCCWLWPFAETKRNYARPRTQSSKLTPPRQGRTIMGFPGSPYGAI